MPDIEDVKKAMDQAAEEARKDLPQDIKTWNAAQLADWWKKWYMKAGHRKLGRIIVKL